MARPVGSQSNMSRGRRRRGGALMWSVGALGLALVMTPLFVSLCHSLSALTARGAHRIVATNRGTAELERLRLGNAESRAYEVPELPAGRCEVTLAAASTPKLRQARVVVSWEEAGRRVQSEWATLVAAGGAP